MDLSTIVTQHPGGYPDILAWLKANGNERAVYKTSKLERDEKDPTVTHEVFTTHKLRFETIAEKIERALAETPPISGLQAGVIQSYLATYNLPTPSSPIWVESSITWLASLPKEGE